MNIANFQQVLHFSHEVDHVIAEKHGGTTEEGNLAYTCWRCNRYKGSDPGSFEPQTGAFSFLFNPRNQQWLEHFKFEGTILVGSRNDPRGTYYYQITSA